MKLMSQFIKIFSKFFNYFLLTLISGLGFSFGIFGSFDFDIFSFDDIIFGFIFNVFSFGVSDFGISGFGDSNFGLLSTFINFS